MWFNARAKLAEIAPAPAPAALLESQKSQKSQAPEAEKDAGGLAPDVREYLDHLQRQGPASYGAMAMTLGWGATRAWRAEAKLRAAGLVRSVQGRAVPRQSNN